MEDGGVQHVRERSDEPSEEESSEEEPVAEGDRSSLEREPSAELSKNQAFDVLRNGRRRAAITCLRERGGKATVKELATCVATKEYDVSAEELSSDQYKRVYTGLYQCHLDRMDDLGVIDFDREGNAVRLRDVASTLDPYLGDEKSLTPERIELGVASIVTLIVLLGLGGVGPFAAISPSSLAALTIAGLVGLALFQLVDLDGSTP